MKNVKSNFILSMIMLTMLPLGGCVFNINEDPDCLECSYVHDGREISEELCDPFFNESDKAAMRTRLQGQADSLNVTLNCIEH